jgi:hypothetical protein
MQHGINVQSSPTVPSSALEQVFFTREIGFKSGN